MRLTKRPKKPGRGAVVDITNEYGSSGITIEYVKSTGLFYISGWYDSMVGIEGTTVDRETLFDLLEVPTRG